MPPRRDDGWILRSAQKDSKGDDISMSMKSPEHIPPWLKSAPRLSLY